MRYLLAIAILAITANLQAQSFDTGSSTYAVVVGISDYQDPGIPDLRFADRDAEAFANFLRSPAGVSLDGDHLKVLTNEQATAGNVGAALYWLVDEVKEGDNVVVYFSGHGDVERKLARQPGFLLCWDSPPAVYISGGVIELGMFQTVISTLSTDIKAKVTVITDACHAGKLSGSTVGGAQLTNANLAQQYANEVKILACQPDEYSIEGEQWGGGRGAFSFNLVNALYGLADANSDLSVTLKEVGRYLEDHVTTEVAPVSQNPKVIGSPTERLALVDAKLLADLRSGRTSQMAMLSPVETRGMEEDVLAGVDTTTRELYRLFKKNLKDKVFLEPAGACADAYYIRLMAEPKMARLHSTMTRNYAAALQDDAQQTLNQWLKTSDNGPRKPSALSTRDGNKQRKLTEQNIKLYPRYLDRAAELLGSKHYMYSILKARKYFFDGYVLAFLSNSQTREQGELAMTKFRQSLQWQPEQPHVYWQMSRIYGYNFQDPDSMVYYAQRAMELHPKWIMPIANTAGVLMHRYQQFDRAQMLLEQASRIDSSDVGTLFFWARLSELQGNTTLAESAYKKELQADSTDIGALINLGLIYANSSRYTEAEASFKKAIQFDSTHTFPYTNLGFVYYNTHRYAEAEAALKKGLQIDSNNVNLYVILGDVYEATQRYDEAAAAFGKVYKPDTSRNDIIRDFLSIGPDTYLLLTMNHGIYKGYGSAPYKMTWTKVLDMDVNKGGNYGFDIFRKDSILLAGIDKQTGGRRGIYRSTDEGSTWTNILHGTGLCFFDDGSTIYAGVDFQGIFKSYDMGKTWTAANNGIPLDPSLRSPSSFVRAGNNLVVSFYGAGRIYISADQGETWSQTAKTNGDVFCMEKVGSTLFAGEQNGLMKSVDNGLTWMYVKNDLLIGTAVTALHVTTGDTLYVGTGNKGLFVTSDVGMTFQPMNKGVGDNLFVSSIMQMNGKLLVGLNQAPGKGGGYYYCPGALGRMLWQYDGDKFVQLPADLHR